MKGLGISACDIDTYNDYQGALDLKRIGNLL
jgi:hypothetical protein